MTDLSEFTMSNPIKAPGGIYNQVPYDEALEILGLPNNFATKQEAKVEKKEREQTISDSDSDLAVQPLANVEVIFDEPDPESIDQLDARAGKQADPLLAAFEQANGELACLLTPSTESRTPMSRRKTRHTFGPKLYSDIQKNLSDLDRWDTQVVENNSQLELILPNALRNAKKSTLKPTTGVTWCVPALHLAALRYTTYLSEDEKRDIGLLPPKGIPAKLWVCCFGGCRNQKTSGGIVNPKGARKFFKSRGLEVVKRETLETEEEKECSDFLSKNLKDVFGDNPDYRPLCLLPIPESLQGAVQKECENLTLADKGVYFACAPHFKQTGENITKKRLNHVFKPDLRLEELGAEVVDKSPAVKKFQETLTKAAMSHYSNS